MSVARSIDRTEVESSRSIRSRAFSRRSSATSSLSSVVTLPRTLRLISSCLTQDPSVESQIPNSQGTCPIDLSDLPTISTASRLNVSMNLCLGRGVHSSSPVRTLFQATHRPLTVCPAHRGIPNTAEIHVAALVLLSLST